MLQVCELVALIEATHLDNNLYQRINIGRNQKIESGFVNTGAIEKKHTIQLHFFADV